MKKYCLLIFVIIYFILVSYIVIAPPPQPHNVEGRVFHSDGTTGVDNGIPVLINDTNNSNYVLTYVYAPEIPSLKGSYSATINGSDNDNITVRAWNSTYYGENISLLEPTTTTVNIVLNLLRPSETNVTILVLQNNSLFNISQINQVNATIAIIGGQNGINCYAVLNISDTSILNLSNDNYIHDLGNIALGSSITTSWNVTGLDEGSTNITVNAYCDSDDINFDGLNYDSIYNVTLTDITAPVIELVSPENNSNISYMNNPVNFIYNVTDESEIVNCSLIINNILNQTNYTIQKETNQYFYQTLAVGNHSWKVECVDNSSSKIKGSSVTYNLTILPNVNPVVSNMTIQDPIDLNPGNTTIVYCNATVRDEDNISDLRSINSTLYHLLVEVNSSDDNNNHYTNNSCKIISSSEFEQNYSCSFLMYYYADQGIWSCNITAYDYSNNTGSSRIDTNVNELIAVDIASSVLDYGDLEAGNTSQEDVNLTITNFGNTDINLTLKGFATTEGDGLAMDCPKGNISVGYEKYSTNFGQDYTYMINLTTDPQQIANFTLLQRTNDTSYKNDRNNTYWKIRIPYSINGQCNGTINMLAVPS